MTAHNEAGLQAATCRMSTKVATKMMITNLYQTRKISKKRRSFGKKRLCGKQLLTRRVGELTTTIRKHLKRNGASRCAVRLLPNDEQRSRRKSRLWRFLQAWSKIFYALCSSSNNNSSILDITPWWKKLLRDK